MPRSAFSDLAGLPRVPRLIKIKRDKQTISDPISPDCAELIKADGVIVMPTDTVYGGCDAWSDAGIQRLYDLKHRSLGSDPILIGSIRQLELVANAVPFAAQRLAERFWPGALTLVLPKHAGLPGTISMDDTIGVRYPNHPFTAALLEASGPMAVTSANLSGMPNTTTAAQVREQLSESIDLLIDGGETPGPVPSTVVDCTRSAPRVLRVGLIGVEEIRKALAVAGISLDE